MANDTNNDQVINELQKSSQIEDPKPPFYFTPMVVLPLEKCLPLLPPGGPRPDEQYIEQTVMLPSKRLSSSVSLRNYMGYWWMEGLVPGAMAVRDTFRPRETDVLIASYPKSGTTWLKALLFVTTTRNKYPLSNHPLLRLNPHACIPFMDILYAQGSGEYVESLPSPRLLATHIPYSVLPESVASSPCKILYVARDPKDVSVSLWHFGGKRAAWSNETFPYEQYFQIFCEGLSAYGPVWDHNLEYWKESLKRPDKVLFLKYEDMQVNPRDALRQIAEFVGCAFSKQEEEGGVVDEMVKMCSFEKLTDLEVNKVEVGEGGVRSSSFFRKGVVGDWKNHLSDEMARKLDQITRDKFRGSGLSFGEVGELKENS